MLILAIDTSTRTGSVAFLRDNQVVDHVSGYEETPYSTRLFRDLELLRSRAQFSLGQIDVFAVTTGPGSFTGLRIGLTAVKAWAEVHGKPIAAISGLEAIAAQGAAIKGQSGSGNEMIAPFIDARRGQVFGAIYRHSISNSAPLQIEGEEAIQSVKDFLQMIKNSADSAQPTLVSPTPEILSSAGPDGILPGAQIVKVAGILAPMVGQLGFARAKRGDLVDSLQLEANYVRRSDAETTWKNV